MRTGLHGYGGARAVVVPLRAEHAFRPQAHDVVDFLATDPRPRAIFLNSPHNPTGGVATVDDLAEIADAIRRTDLVVFSELLYYFGDTLFGTTGGAPVPAPAKG